MTASEYPDIGNLYNRETAVRFVGSEENLDAMVFSSCIIELQVSGPDGETSPAYPKFQFSDHGGISPIVGAINVLLQASHFPDAAASWWLTPHDELNKHTPPAELVQSTDWIDQNAILQQAIKLLEG